MFLLLEALPNMQFVFFPADAFVDLILKRVEVPKSMRVCMIEVFCSNQPSTV